MDRKYISLIKDIVIFAVGNIGSKLILFLLVPLYTNYMTTAEYGTSELVFTASQLVLPFVSLVIYDAVIRFGLVPEEKKGDVLLCGLIVAFCGSIVTVFLTPLAGLHKRLAPWKWYLCIYLIFSIFDPILMNHLKVCGKNRHYAVISVLRTFVMAVLNIVLLVQMRLGIQGYLLANIGGIVFCLILSSIAGEIFTYLKYAELRLDLLKRMLLFSMPLILNNASWWVIQSSNKLMIEWMVGISALGIYTVATKIPSLINVVISIFSQAWGIASIKEIESTSDTSMYSQVFLIYQTLVFGAALVLTSIIQPFMKVYVGSSFVDAWRYVPLLFVSASFSAVASYFGSVYSALKKSVNNMVTTVIAAFINVGVNLALIPRIGVWGAVFGTVSAYIAIALLRIVDVPRYLPIDIDWKLFLGNAVIVLTQAIFVSLNIKINVVSVVAFFVFLIINGRVFFAILCRTKQK